MTHLYIILPILLCGFIRLERGGKNEKRKWFLISEHLASSTDILIVAACRRTVLCEVVLSPYFSLLHVRNELIHEYSDTNFMKRFILKKHIALKRCYACMSYSRKVLYILTMRHTIYVYKCFS